MHIGQRNHLGLLRYDFLCFRNQRPLHFPLPLYPLHANCLHFHFHHKSEDLKQTQGLHHSVHIYLHLHPSVTMLQGYFHQCQIFVDYLVCNKLHRGLWCLESFVHILLLLCYVSVVYLESLHLFYWVMDLFQ
uniref:Uncharacterized protein n=1 Tax=Cacopsylla melanoneura TaxID=428564 RepID=A0A8D9E656_9HEMI